MVTDLFLLHFNNCFFSCCCFLSRGALSWQLLLGPRGGMASFEAKTPPGFPSFSRMPRTRIFSCLMSAHRQSWLKAFCGGSKAKQFCPHLCTHKVLLAVVAHTQSDEAAVAEAAREVVKLLHVPEPWCCYRTVPLHLPHPHHQCVSASRSDFSCLYPYFT